MGIFSKRRDEGSIKDSLSDIASNANGGDISSPDFPDYRGSKPSTDAERDAVFEASRKSVERLSSMSRDSDLGRRKAFSIACALATVFGIGVVALGTLSVYGRISKASSDSQPQQLPAQSSRPAGAEDAAAIYYDDTGRMHISLYAKSAPDISVSVRMAKPEPTPAPTPEPPTSYGPTYPSYADGTPADVSSEAEPLPPLPDETGDDTGSSPDTSDPSD